MIGSLIKKGFPEEGDVAHSTCFRTFFCLVTKEINIEQDLSPDRIARLILHILFLENSVHDLDFDMTCGGGGGGGGQYLSLHQIGTKSIM